MVYYYAFQPTVVLEIAPHLLDHVSQRKFTHAYDFTGSKNLEQFHQVHIYSPFNINWKPYNIIEPHVINQWIIYNPLIDYIRSHVCPCAALLRLPVYVTCQQWGGISLRHSSS